MKEDSQKSEKEVSHNYMKPTTEGLYEVVVEVVEVHGKCAAGYRPSDDVVRGSVFTL